MKVALSLVLLSIVVVTKATINVVFVPTFMISPCAAGSLWNPNITCVSCLCITGYLSRCTPTPECNNQVTNRPNIISTSSSAMTNPPMLYPILVGNPPRPITSTTTKLPDTDTMQSPPETTTVDVSIADNVKSGTALKPSIDAAPTATKKTSETEPDIVHIEWKLLTQQCPLRAWWSPGGTPCTWCFCITSYFSRCRITDCTANENGITVSKSEPYSTIKAATPTFDVVEPIAAKSDTTNSSSVSETPKSGTPDNIIIGSTTIATIGSLLATEATLTIYNTTTKISTLLPQEESTTMTACSNHH